MRMAQQAHGRIKALSDVWDVAITANAMRHEQEQYISQTMWAFNYDNATATLGHNQFFPTLF